MTSPTHAKTEPRKRRAPRGQRRKLIVEGALKVFAEKGFSAGTREIAASLGVTQALLYRYFDSKDALIDAVFETRYGSDRFMPDAALLNAAGKPLEDRVRAFYAALFEGLRDGSMQLFIRASIEGYPAARFYSRTLARSSIIPLIRALRAEAGPPVAADRPICDAEYELGMAQHGGVTFIAIRNLVYRHGPRTPVDEAIARHTRIWLAGARPELERIHADWERQTPLPAELAL